MMQIVLFILFLCMLITFYYIKNNYFGNTSYLFKYKICILHELSIFNNTYLVIYFPYLFKYENILYTYLIQYIFNTFIQ